jgi:hypothetical protein
MFGYALVAIGSILAGYLYSESRQGKMRIRQAKKAIKEAGIRPPRPDFAMHLPNTPEDFDTLDEVVCMCALQINAERPGLSDQDFTAYIFAVRDCVAAALYPDFEWPPMAGDHPTVEKLWTVLTYEVSRSAIEDSLCLTEPEAEEGAAEGNPNIQFIPPPY